MDESQEQTAESWGSKKKIRREMKIKCSVKVLHMKKKTFSPLQISNIQKVTRD